MTATERPSEADVEALARSIFAVEQVARHESVEHRWATTLNDDDQNEYRDIACTVLASDWLAAHDAQVRADAWDEGWVTGMGDSAGLTNGTRTEVTANPYRALAPTPREEGR
ncbi:hypothetical protein L2K70_04840 [Nocardioides KLBMP 9356]|uniref:Uncharacterized protein n=1 Tax=Nocardioides potassii TaxID=2911371 RepID=A0ABS9H6S0_9ACTN|nr:hypothetical protein [Nocardioides potassii]MCF6376922.1 hypothetical protein [Nocardioides potassii]